MSREERSRYLISAALTFLIFFLLFLSFVLVQLIPDRRIYGASRLTVNLNPADSPRLAAEKQDAYQPLPQQSTQETTNGKSRETAKSGSKSSAARTPVEDDYIEPEFEDLMTGSGSQTVVSGKKRVDESEGSSVQYDEEWDTMTPSQAEGREGEESRREDLLQESQLEKLNRAGEADSQQASRNPDSASGGYGTGADDRRSDSDIIVDLDDYERNRKKLSGGFPDLSGIDLAGRRFFEAVVLLQVEPSGSISSVTVIRSSGSSEIDNALVRAMRYWKFERVPGTRVDSPRLRLQWRPGNEN